MKSKFVFMLLGATLLSNAAKADSMSFELSTNGGANVSVQTSGELYNFSPEFLEAVKNCSAYQYDFTKENPKKQDVPFLGQVDLDVMVNIKGWAGDNCLFAMDYKMIGVQNIMYDCALSRQQVDEVYSAMLDRSGEMVEETYTTYDKWEVEGQAPVEQSQQNTIKGTRFDVWSAKIKQQFCVGTPSEPTKEEQEEASKKQMELSEDFKKALLACTPAKDSKIMMMSDMNAEIVGMNEDKCLVKYDNFDLYIPMAKMADITSWIDIMQLSEDKTIRKYNPQYKTEGAVLALVACQQGSSSGSSYSKMNNVERGFKGEHRDGKCTLSFIDKLVDADNVEDYSKICVVDDGIIADVLRPYETLIQEHYASYPNKYTHNKETRRADNEIFDLLVKSGACGAAM